MDDLEYEAWLEQWKEYLADKTIEDWHPDIKDNWWRPFEFLLEKYRNGEYPTKEQNENNSRSGE